MRVSRWILAGFQRIEVAMMEAVKKCARPALTAGVAVVLVLAGGEISPVWAQEAEDPGVSDLDTVINNIRNWLVGLLVVLATLLLTIGGLRYLLAGGDPGEVNKAKDTLKYSALGYLVAILAPILVQILRGFVGLQ
ncbi:hypothetical protein GCM10028793_47980 [Nocardiopsis oceani]